MTESFAKYRNQKRQRVGKCCVCAKPVEGRVVVTLQAKTENPEKQTGEANRHHFPSVSSRSGSYCEKHASELYDQIAKLVTADGHGA